MKTRQILQVQQYKTTKSQKYIFAVFLLILSNNFFCNQEKFTKKINYQKINYIFLYKFTTKTFKTRKNCMYKISLVLIVKLRVICI